MNDRERNKAFRRERARQLKRLIAAEKATAARVLTILRQTAREVGAELAGQPSDYAAWHLSQVQRSVRQASADLGQALGRTAGEGAAEAWGIGGDIIDKPIAAGGVNIGAMIPDIDVRPLMAIRKFMTGRMRDVSVKIARKIDTEIGLVMTGVRTPGEAVSKVSDLVEGGRGRALTIVRTEMGRSFSVAGQERMEQAGEHLPGLQKQWRRSGKIHSRVAHDVADGQIVDTKKPFAVGGVSLMYPRDPDAPAAATVNCGCVSLPHMAHWEVKQPGRQAFSDREVFRNPAKRDLARALNPDVDPAASGATRIKTLERLSPAAARRQISEDLATPSFRRFVTDPDPPTGQRAVAVIPDDIAGALGVGGRIARLSSYTTVKQQARRRGQRFDADDYRRIQGLLDNGTVVASKPNHLEVYGKSDGDTWMTVIKATGDGSEVYVQSLRRSDQRSARKRAKKHRVVRKQK
jgi:hypothetical protein